MLNSIQTRLFLVYVLLAILACVFFAPFVWLVITSFKPESEIFNTGLPSRWVLENYTKGLHQFPFGVFFRNTLFLCTINVIGVVISSSLVAYGLARIPWKGRHALFAVLLSTMMLPAQVTMVPLFAVYKVLGWIDTFLPLTVPSFLGNAFYVFLLRQFFLTIPNDLTDAARLDGCTEFDIYRRVILPLATPALATVALFSFLNTWNDFLGPLIYLFDTDKLTLSLGLAMFNNQYGSYWGQLMAVSVVMTLPILVLFFFTQRTFIQGITFSGLKG
jgi:multiple sugar transport system permease protein